MTNYRRSLDHEVPLEPSTASDESTATLHDRMPLVLPAGVFADWLHGSPDQAMAIALGVAPPSLVFHPVGSEVGNVRNTGPQLMEPASQAGLL